MRNDPDKENTTQELEDEISGLANTDTTSSYSPEDPTEDSNGDPEED